MKNPEEFQLFKSSARRWTVIELDLKLTSIYREGGVQLKDVLQYRAVTKPLARELALDCLAVLRHGARLPDSVLKK